MQWLGGCNAHYDSVFECVCICVSVCVCVLQGVQVGLCNKDCEADAELIVLGGAVRWDAENVFVHKHRKCLP